MYRHTRGFTLIEVLIALCIIAIALSAAIRATTESTRATTHVKTTMAAHWVALNVLSQIQTKLLTFSKSNEPLQGKTEMLAKTWTWTAQSVISPELPGVRRIIVTVSFKNKAVDTLIGYEKN